MSATASPSVSILSSYNASGAKGSARGGPRRVHDGGRMHVHDQDRLARVPRLGEGIQIGEVQARVSVRETESRDRNNGATWIIYSSDLDTHGRAAELTYVESQPIFNVTWLMEAMLHQCLDSRLAGGALNRGKKCVPLGGNFRIGREARNID